MTFNNTMFSRIRSLFEKQGLMKTLGANLLSIEKGLVKIEVAFSNKLTQQHGYFHAGVTTSIVDTACGFAALTMMDEDADVLSVEFKVNFLKPAKTPRLFAIGKVVQAGRTLTVCEGLVYDETETSLIAKMTATLITVKS